MDIQTDNISKKVISKKAKLDISIICFTIIFSSALTVLFFSLFSLFIPKLSVLITNALTFITNSPLTIAKKITENLFNSLAFNYFFNLFANFLCFFLPFVFLGKYIFKMSFDEIMPLSGKTTKMLVPLYGGMQLASSFFSSVAVIIWSLFFVSAQNTEFSYQTAFTDVTTPSFPELVIYGLSLCIFTPLIEEYVFRGVIYKRLRKYGFAFAVFSSALIFGISHSGPAQMTSAVVSGIFFAVITEKTGNIKGALILHSLNNFSAFLFVDILPIFTNDHFAYITSVIFDLIIACFAVFGMIWLYKNKENTDYGTFIKSQGNGFSLGISSVFSVGFIFLFVDFLFNSLQYM